MHSTWTAGRSCWRRLHLSGPSLTCKTCACACASACVCVRMLCGIVANFRTQSVHRHQHREPTTYLESSRHVIQITANAANEMRVAAVAAHRQALQQLQTGGTEHAGQRAHFVHLRVLAVRQRVESLRFWNKILELKKRTAPKKQHPKKKTRRLITLLTLPFCFSATRAAPHLDLLAAACECGSS